MNYYFNNKMVYIGERIFINDLNVKLSVDFINSNLSCFTMKTDDEVKIEKLKYLQEAKRRYKVGDTILTPNRGREVKLNGEPHTTCTNNIVIFGYCEQTSAHGSKDCILYEDGKWAEIVRQLVLRTDDGVDIYVDDSIYIVYTSGINRWSILTGIILSNKSENIKLNNDVKIFSTNLLAEKFVKENKPKRLEDYKEIIALNIAYGMLKKSEPKMYWRKIYQMIADDLNGNWSPKTGEEKYFIYEDNEGNVKIMKHGSVKYDLVYFKTECIADEALEIMGNNIYYTI